MSAAAASHHLVTWPDETAELGAIVSVSAAAGLSSRTSRLAAKISTDFECATGRTLVPRVLQRGNR
jgi:hypothetical protein